MSTSPSAHARLDTVSAAGWRLLFAAVALALLVRVLTETRHFASAAVLAAATALLLVDVARVALRGREGALAPPATEERARAQQLDRALALLDAVTVALFALGPDGRIRFANRAARGLVGEVARLEDALDGRAAADILALPVGARRIVALSDGRSMLVWVGAVATPDGGPQRLVSMQAVLGELDAVQVGAWHAMSRVLAHEMMNALTPVASLAESLARMAGGDSRPAVGAAADTIARQSRHLIDFVERYRAVADLPAPAFAPLDLATFLADIAALVDAQLRARGIAFSAALPAAALPLEADAGLLRQALLNLLRNAGEAVAGAGGGAVRFACAMKDGELRFEVRDDGPGIRPERIEEIFVPFYTTKEGGAGIGLALARQIALAHGGRLTAAPNSGRGMTFVLAIPASRGG
ncbi:MAG: sensor histidine kinase [Alphaproteobacteria bacterium]|nr:sensor histidine kinase [Alphaproteobacteria bacterium]MBV9370807.1 sensor histidine kinase [Alphaproteobacteria bacterium]MBV9900113.1 sensor histidine kinase [Alphaproteobacteria bacterium]